MTYKCSACGSTKVAFDCSVTLDANSRTVIGDFIPAPDEFAFCRECDKEGVLSDFNSPS